MTTDTASAAPRRSSLGPFLGGLVVGVVVGALATAVVEPYIGMRAAPTSGTPHAGGPVIPPPPGPKTDHPMDERRPAAPAAPEVAPPAPGQPVAPESAPPPPPPPKTPG